MAERSNIFPEGTYVAARMEVEGFVVHHDTSGAVLIRTATGEHVNIAPRYLCTEHVINSIPEPERKWLAGDLVVDDNGEILMRTADGKWYHGTTGIVADWLVDRPIRLLNIDKDGI